MRVINVRENSREIERRKREERKFNRMMLMVRKLVRIHLSLYKTRRVFDGRAISSSGKNEEKRRRGRRGRRKIEIERDRERDEKRKMDKRKGRKKDGEGRRDGRRREVRCVAMHNQTVDDDSLQGAQGRRKKEEMMEKRKKKEEYV